jgi:hypothetical protein
MSELKKQIEAARKAYREERYAGDLARDVMGQGWGRPWWLGAIAAAGVGVAVGVWWMQRVPNQGLTAPQGAVVISTNTGAPTADASVAEAAVWAVPAMPEVDAAELVPQTGAGSLTMSPATVEQVGGPPSLGGMPSLPSLADVVAADDAEQSLGTEAQ